MNNRWFKNIISKVFSPGQPLYFYIGINVLVFLVTGIVGVLFFLAGKDAGFADRLISQYLAFPADISFFPERFYTLLTYQFLHSGLMHLLFNMLMLYWMGIIFLDFLKPRQFHFVYLTGGIVGALFYMAAFNLFPVFERLTPVSVLVGSSASVMGIAAATATLVPNYTVRLFLFGFVKLKYLVIALLALDILYISSTNPGGSFAHLGGAFAGFAYIKLVQTGTDISNWFKRKPKLKVVKNNKHTNRNPEVVDQREIDVILDKISRSGYEKLTTEEKARLFKASEK